MKRWNYNMKPDIKKKRIINFKIKIPVIIGHLQHFQVQNIAQRENASYQM